MKTLTTILSFFLITWFIFPGFAQTDYPGMDIDPPKIKKVHLEWVKKYENLAKDQEKIADEHSKMKKDYMKKYWVNEKQSSKQKIQEMENHCDKIIETALKQKKHYEMMAEFHRSLASELDNKK